MKGMKKMTQLMLEHWGTMSNKEIFQELFCIFAITIVIMAITGILQYIKNKYNDKVEASNSKTLKFIFKNIL